MFKFKMSLLFNNLKFRVAIVVLIIAAIAAGIIFIPKNKASNMNTSLTSNDIIKEASKLLGKGYWNKDSVGAGHGVTGNLWEKKYPDNIKLLGIDEFSALDCTGFVYYTLTSLGCATSGFEYNNPVPVDPNHWYNYSNPTITYKGQTAPVKVLKEGVSVEDMPYYMCKDGSELPAGTIIVAAAKKMETSKHDHAWIYLGNFGTTDVKEVAKILINDVGVSSNLLINGDINGEFTIKTYVNGLGKTVPVIQKTDDNSTHWRIECTADATGYGVYINNGDPTSSLTVTDPNTGKKKLIGPIYAFQIANESEKVAGDYSITLKKVKKDGTTVIAESEATFKVNGTEQNTKSGILNIATSKTISDTNQVDTYEIVETKAPEGYKLFNGTVKLEVKFKKDGNKYIIDKDKTTSTGLPEGAKIEIAANGQNITIYIPNDEEEKITGNYNVTLKKVKKDGTTVITESEATFKINGEEKNTEKGILNIVSNKNISDVNKTDTYEIIETKAPEGYKLFNGTVKIDVKFKELNKKYIVDGDKTTTTGLPEGGNVKISPNGEDITIYIPNEPEPGTYDVELHKVDENGQLIKTTAKFNVNGTEKETVEGIVNVASGVKVVDSSKVDTYTIKETTAPENYKMFDGTLTLKVKMAETENGYELKEDGISLTTDKENKNVKFTVEGNVVKVYVPNEHKIFDLALRKYISKVNDVEIKESREPVINEKSLEQLIKTGTAEYYHTKNSVAVNVGDLVEYTIRIYNEGEILGYAKQVTDYLPDGLIFVKLEEETAKKYETDATAESKVVTIKYKGARNIQLLRELMAQKLELTEEYYQEIKLVCQVVDTEKTYITSRAEITNYGYYEKNEEGQKVWKEAIQLGNSDIDSIQNTIKDALKLDTWYEENVIKNTPKVENYYPGTQDDDDFETVEVLSGKYNVVIKKVDSTDKNKVLEGAYFTVKTNSEEAQKIGPTSNKGEVTVKKGVKILKDNQIDTYTIKEVEAPKNYNLYEGEITVKVATKYNGKNYIIDAEKTIVAGKNIEYIVNKENTTITIVIPNEPKGFDLSLRKFITEVNGEKITESREPQVDTSKLISGESTTATYNHSKEPVDVNTTDIVTYTIRVYNEGELDAYASKVMDDVPEGLVFIPATYDENGKPTNTNAQYGWTLYREVKDGESTIPESTISYDGKSYVITDKAEEADVIVTEYLSKENGTDNLIKAFDSKTMTELDYRDVKVSFKVIEPTTSDRIIINYAQITEHTDSDGNTTVTDIDSTPNEWNDGEDDQDIEKIKVRYFDLSLLKWVTKAIVYENGMETITETGHTGYENPEPIVKVDLKNTSLNNVEVKFEYTIRITNEGEIAGYAKEISDYIPEGLKFIPADNPQWTQVDGKIVTRALENTLLKPGETADVTVLLTWINDKNNLGLKVNTAEISEDYNDYGTPDIDSTPNNIVPDEDDIDDAPVMLAIRTGSSIVYTGVILASLAIISIGAVVIRKKVM